MPVKHPGAARGPAARAAASSAGRPTRRARTCSWKYSGTRPSASRFGWENHSVFTSLSIRNSQPVSGATGRPRPLALHERRLERRGARSHQHRVARRDGQLSLPVNERDRNVRRVLRQRPFACLPGGGLAIRRHEPSSGRRARAARRASPRGWGRASPPRRGGMPAQHPPRAAAAGSPRAARAATASDSSGSASASGCRDEHGAHVVRRVEGRLEGSTHSTRSTACPMLRTPGPGATPTPAAHVLHRGHAAATQLGRDAQVDSGESMR